MADKKLKDELKTPDTFQRVGGEASNWLAVHQKSVAAAAGVVLLGFLVVALVSHFSKRSEEKASTALGEALQVLSRPVEGQGFVDPEAAEKPFKTQKERDEAVKKALEDFRASHEGTRAATTAALPLAQAEQRLGHPDAALALFTEYLDGTPKGAPERSLALEGQGYAQEAKGNLDAALAAFDKLDQEAQEGDLLVGMGAYHKARILILQGKKDEAAQQLAQIPSKHPNTAAARLATERLAVLASQGVKVPTPAAPAAATQDAG